ncbi:hypothetical protein RJJ37_29565 [Rhizobium redzepovicii]|uniref:HNH endonuclease n=1 Tax=Rhizobium redzepovicii TaxID=2867518 RepID=A0AAW8P9N4_9HYPH|nr:hypothetical protein [Rhizobium redzepovicii]MDR9763730.1 hypothetical protein [Rhizobium redzepovicii]
MTSPGNLTHTQRMLAAQPFCVFCGGTTQATTLDHMPSRVLFDGKHRPKGLEFSSCQPCQDSTRKAETVFAVLSRFYPEPTTNTQRAEFQKLLRAAERHNPGFMREMETDQVGHLHRLGNEAALLPSWNFLNVSGPICTDSISAFSVKLGLALHYEITRQIVPKGGVVVVARFSNVDAFTGDMPKAALTLFGEGQTLEMGKFRVADQFEYSSVYAGDTMNMSAHFATFRMSMALLLLACHSEADIPQGVHGDRFRV